MPSKDRIRRVKAVFGGDGDYGPCSAAHKCVGRLRIVFDGYGPRLVPDGCVRQPMPRQSSVGKDRVQRRRIVFGD